MRKTKKTIGNDSRPKAELPEIFVKTTNAMRAEYARAHIRVKGGKYLYLAWKDGDRVRNFYLGQKKNSALPTSPARGSDRDRRRGAAGTISVGQKNPRLEGMIAGAKAIFDAAQKKKPKKISG